MTKTTNYMSVTNLICVKHNRVKRICSKL